MTASAWRPEGLKTFFAGIFCWAGLFLLLHHWGAMIPQFDQRFATFFSAALLTFLSILVVYGFSCLGLPRQNYLLIGFLAGFAVFFAAQPMIEKSRQVYSNAEAGRQLLFISSGTVSTIPESALDQPGNTIFTDIRSAADSFIPDPAMMIILLGLAQLALASGIGLWIAEGIDDITHLIPVGLVATIADIWSVSAGATARIIVSENINFFLLRFPLPAYHEIPYLIGLTDFLFFAIFFQAAVRYQLGTIRNALLLASSFIIAVVSALFTGAGLPVLPFMAVFFIIGNFSRLQWKKEELKQVAVFVIVILILFAILSYKLNQG
ncbi:MAG: hypothetical protein AB1403_08155 [Candidatus Riflebacteria bacterium]